MSRSPTSRRGFSLVEVLVTCFIWAMFCGMLGQCMVMGYRAHQTVEKHVVARRKLQAALEVIRGDVESHWRSDANTLPVSAPVSIANATVFGAPGWGIEGGVIGYSGINGGGTTTPSGRGGPVYSLVTDPTDGSCLALIRLVPKDPVTNVVNGIPRYLIYGIVNDGNNPPMTVTYQSGSDPTNEVLFTVKSRDLPYNVTMQAQWEGL